METMTTLLVIGVCNILFTWPFLVVLHYTGIETFELPSGDQIGIVLGTAMLSFVFDLSFALAIFMTNPILVSISSALVIPLSFVADHVLHGAPLFKVSFAGVAVVAAGLYVMNSETETVVEGKGEGEGELLGRGEASAMKRVPSGSANA